MKKLFLLTLVGSAMIAAAPPAKFELSVASIMRGPKLVGYAPDSVRWAGDSKEFWFEWRKPGDALSSTWVANAATGEARKLSDEERKGAPPPSAEWDQARRRALFSQAGDVVLVDTVAKKRRVITRTAANETRPRFARNETHVAFIRDGALYLVPISGDGDDLLVQLFEAGPKKKEPTLTDSQTVDRDEEAKLLLHVEKATEERKEREAKREAEALPKLEIPEGESVIDAVLSEDGVHAYITVSVKATGSKTADVPNYITESSYSEPIPTRNRVGDSQEKRKLAILNLKTRKSVWATLPLLKTETKPAEGKTETKDRDARWSLFELSPDGKLAVAAVRSADNKDRWLVRLDPETGAGAVLFADHDDAWIRELFGAGGFLPDGRTLWFTSEKPGFMHLFTVDASAANPTSDALTGGEWEIADVQPSVDRKTFYLTSTEAGAGERHLYSMPVGGGARTRVTTAVGAHDVAVSPDGSLLATVYSASNKPPEVYVGPASNDLARRVTTSPSAEWLAAKWLDPRIVMVKARDGVQVPARLYRPEDVGAKVNSKHPAVIFVHGAGYLQNAHRYWSGYFREYMFHHVLASKGYVVIDIDYRGSAGYGRDWRTAIYRHMGGADLNDIVDGAKYLVKDHEVDPKRIGVYGGSYGGFITLMGMFTTPGTFAAGAALRPVTDWAHYNHGYTSNILNLPQGDQEAYKKSSPIYFAEGLKGALLICHGVVDTNVHFSDSVRLAQKLIELRKDNWELAMYPVENHGFDEETSWADEYSRIFKLFERELKR
ncbi:MAG: S9 family peptidase [Vicinamibacteria bacterium]|nr:S9 family peptidase [Vicinamibacteria bacterium]